MLRVEICIKGNLDENWSEWLDGFSLARAKNNGMVLKGNVKDQAALYGLIAKLRDLGIELVSIDTVPFPD